MSNPILVVDQVLTAVAGEPARQPLEDYVLSMVFANAAARASGLAADAQARPQSFTSQWSNQLGNLGWVVTEAGNLRIITTSARGTTTVAEQVERQAGGDAIADGLTALKRLVAGEEPGAQALADMFWNAAAQGDVLVGSIGQVSIAADGSPALELATLTLQLGQLEVPRPGLFGSRTEPLGAASAAALFAEVVAASVDLSVSRISASLPANIFAAKRDEVVAKLGDRVVEHYRALPPDLITAAS